MKNKLTQSLQSPTSLFQVRDSVIEVCRIFRIESGSDRLGYVAGILYSDGPEHVERNIRVLEEHTDRLRRAHDFPIFSSVDVFYSRAIHEGLSEYKLPYEDRRIAFIQFWRDILECGHVTDIFMTPRWEKSEGARDEYETAKKLGMNIHIVESDKV